MTDALTQAAHERVDAILAVCWAEIEDQNMTWKEASGLLGISESTLDNWRAGRARPNATGLFKLVFGLGVSI